MFGDMAVCLVKLAQESGNSRTEMISNDRARWTLDKLTISYFRHFHTKHTAATSWDDSCKQHTTLKSIA